MQATGSYLTPPADYVAPRSKVSVVRRLARQGYRQNEIIEATGFKVLTVRRAFNDYLRSKGIIQREKARQKTACIAL